MKKIELEFLVSLDASRPFLDIDSYLSRLIVIFPSLKVHKESSLEKGIQALKIELAKGASETKNKAFNRIIKDREAMLPAITFQIDAEGDVVGILNRHFICLSCKSKKDIPDDVAKVFEIFIKSIKGKVFVDGIERAESTVST